MLSGATGSETGGEGIETRFKANLNVTVEAA